MAVFLNVIISVGIRIIITLQRQSYLILYSYCLLYSHVIIHQSVYNLGEEYISKNFSTFSRPFASLHIVSI